jgi:hypothetical protein
MQQWVIEEHSDEGKRLVWHAYSVMLCDKKRANFQVRNQRASYIQRLARDTDDLTNVPGVMLGKMIQVNNQTSPM